jgi:peptide deformylase
MIITNNESLLRTKCDDVLSEEVESLINYLQIDLDNANRLGKGGVGLAAPQIGIYKKISIIRFDKFKLNLVNCNIEKVYDSYVFKQESCLSFPGRAEDTTRFKEIYVTNNLVYPYSFVVTGLLAVIVQHELDHLNGILFFDKMIKPPIKVKIGPNDLCVCGKKIKYKKCCGKN